MGDHNKIPLEVCYFLNELFKMQGHTTVGKWEGKNKSELVDSTKEKEHRA